MSKLLSADFSPHPDRGPVGTSIALVNRDSGAGADFRRRQIGRIAAPFGRGAKRALDIAGALTGLLLVASLLAPLFLVVAIMIRSDGGPLLFRHHRIGRGGRLFNCLKLRTMAVNAEHALAQAVGHDPERVQEWQRGFKLRQDPRITPFGRLLRRTSLDELPQLINVLRGEMSLVGPRPIVPGEIERYGDDFTLYLQVRPGLTGLWQVSGRNNLDYATRVRLDADYVRSWSLRRDLTILLRTVPALLTGRGAC